MTTIVDVFGEEAFAEGKFCVVKLGLFFFFFLGWKA